MDDVVFDPQLGLPLYRQLAELLAGQIESGTFRRGDKLQPTRELAGKLGLNRTTVAAAYALLEEQGLIRGHVGRGSFVVGSAERPKLAGLDWANFLPRLGAGLGISQPAEISFASSRPADEAFPMKEFRRFAREVIDSPDAREILQLGSPAGYPPLRRFLLEQATREGAARTTDDLIVTNGCQQALDLLARVLASNGETVLVEDPVYHGLLRVFDRAGASIVPVPVTEDGADLNLLETAISRHKPRAIVLTPSFQNPTGLSVPLVNRRCIVDVAARAGVVVIENDIYSELRYEGEPVPTLKRLDESGNVILLRSYSKVSFPGLRVGWVIAPHPLIQRLTELKQTTDLHSDQLSQAVLLRFAQSPQFAQHIAHTRKLGGERLVAALDACERYLPAGTAYTRPRGGMNLWVELPAPLEARKLLVRVQDQGVNFMPGDYFSVNHGHSRCLRLSFGGLSPEEIERGVKTIGEAAAGERTASSRIPFEPAPALV
jgi:2-aminoadipate transaminase